MSQRTIGRRVPAEYNQQKGNYFPAYGQQSRGVAPAFAQGSGCVGAFDSTTLTFKASSLAAGLTTLTAKAYLPNVQRLTTASFDIGQAHFSTHSYTAPAGVMVGQISLALGSPSATIAVGDPLPVGTTLIGLFVTGTTTVYAPSMVATPISFSVPVTVIFLGDVKDA